MHLLVDISTAIRTTPVNNGTHSKVTVTSLVTPTVPGVQELRPGAAQEIPEHLDRPVDRGIADAREGDRADAAAAIRVRGE